MKPRSSLFSTLCMLLVCALHVTGVPAVRADRFDDLLRRLEWRNIGPAIMGGRIDDLAVVEQDPRTVYMATASGGLFKTVNSGTTWRPIFDDQATSSIGDVTVAPSNPGIVWVGTGEPNNRQSSSWGHGVYKSTNGGETWEHMGLAETHHIGRIVIHPDNPDIVYVAAAGKLWGPNPERGLYRTADGGKTWEKVLYINEDTGCIDVAMDPENPDVLYAATYQRRRTPFGFNGGGPGSGLYKTTDGGRTWKKLTNGLPATDLGRIGIAIYRRNPRILYIVVETRNGNISGANSGSTYRSDDGGETWVKTSDVNPRPMYYSKIYVDPNDDKRVWMLGAALYASTDGARTFTTRFGQRIHSDFHALWINPANSDHMILAGDGGIQWSYDRGQTWDFVNTIPLAQFYEITYDMRKPYYVYGGLQDNGTWAGPSAITYARGISNDEWYNVGGGDGFYAQVNPKDHTVLYTESQNGAARRIDQKTGESKSIRPVPPPGETYRFDWNTPLLISPHNPNKIYMAGNRLFISTDRGDSWRRTEDLTTKPDRSKMPIFGVPVTNRTLSANDGQDSFGQIVTVTESPLRPGLLYVGTDDGLVQMSRDDGYTWINLTDRFPGVPKGTYVSRVVASAHAEGRAYVAFDGHRSNDFRPYIFVTEDYGQTWRLIANGIPEGSTVNVIREHFRNGDLLFAGTERGLYISFDRGQSWKRVPPPLPTVPVDDIQIHPRENDLILGTHGRGAFIADDITFLEQAARAESYPIYLCDLRPAIAYRLHSHKGTTGHRIFLAPNPPQGVIISFFLKEKPERNTDVRLTVLDRDGKNVVRELRVPLNVSAGYNRVIWDLRHDSPLASLPEEEPSAEAGRGARGQSGGQGGATGGRPSGGQGPGGRTGFLTGPRVLPGLYLVRLKFGNEEQIKPVRVEEDPRLAHLVRERRAQHETLMRLGALQRSAILAQRALQNVRRQISALQQREALKSASTSLQDRVVALSARVDTLQARLAPRPVRSGGRPAGQSSTEGGPSREGAQEGESAPNEPETRPAATPSSQPILPRITSLQRSLEAITEAPSRASMETVRLLEAEVKKLIAEVNEINGRVIPAINRELKISQMEPLLPGARLSLSQQ